MKDKTAQWLYHVSGKQIQNIVLLTSVQAFHEVSVVFRTLLLRSVVDAAVGRNSVQFWRFAVFFSLLMVLQIALRAVIRWLGELSRAGLENSFKQRLFHHLLWKDYASVSAVHSAEWINRLTSDTRIVAEDMVDILPGFAGMGVRLICALAMLLLLERRFAVILLPGGVFLILFSWLFRKRLKRFHKAVREQDGKLRVFFQERIAAMPILHAFSVEKQTETEAVERMAAHKTARMRKNYFSNICNSGFGVAMQSITLFGIVSCGYGILKGTVSFGTFTAVIQLISQVQSPFANLTGYLPRYYAMIASAERLMEIEDFREENESVVLSRQEVDTFYKERFASIVLRNAAFTYYPSMEQEKRDQPVVLDRLNLEIKKGEIVAFTGTSGCGKSTVLKLLMCLYSLDQGDRQLMDREGLTIPLTAAWRRLFAYAPQGHFLLSGTVREVVSFSAPEQATDNDALNRALEISEANFVKDLPHGLDTLLGERGTGLSEGQMQRLAIARAIFADRPILLLDESTSALDAETEKRLLAGLKKLTDKTVVIVTHRPAALDICDRVLHFTENGVTEL